MRKIIQSKINGQTKRGTNRIIGKFRELLTEKAILLFPTFWALVPVKPKNDLRSKAK